MLSDQSHRARPDLPGSQISVGNHIELCVRWYLTYGLSYRDLVAMMAERGVTLSHTTIFRWVQRYVPEFESRWSRYAKPVHSSWRMDETAISVRGGPLYLYRAVDKFGKTVDSLLCPDRTEEAARAFFCKALETNQPRRPQKVNLDGNAASHRALRVLRQEHPGWQSVVVRGIFARQLFKRFAQSRDCEFHESAGFHGQLPLSCVHQTDGHRVWIELAPTHS
jgi:transposase-like protein